MVEKMGKSVPNGSPPRIRSPDGPEGVVDWPVDVVVEDAGGDVGPKRNAHSTTPKPKQ